MHGRADTKAAECSCMCYSDGTPTHVFKTCPHATASTLNCYFSSLLNRRQVGSYDLYILLAISLRLWLYLVWQASMRASLDSGKIMQRNLFRLQMLWADLADKQYSRHWTGMPSKKRSENWKSDWESGQKKQKGADNGTIQCSGWKASKRIGIQMMATQVHPDGRMQIQFWLGSSALRPQHQTRLPPSLRTEDH
jgi:hypothetical protein